MSVERIDHPDGTYTLRADNSDRGDLRGCFDGINATDQVKKDALHSEFGGQHLVNRGGKKVWVRGDRIDKKLKQGFQMATAACGISMPAGFLGFGDDGRIVYEDAGSDGKWEQVDTTNGRRGWAIVLE